MSPGHIKAKRIPFVTKHYDLNWLSIEMIGMFILIWYVFGRPVYREFGDTTCNKKDNKK